MANRFKVEARCLRDEESAVTVKGPLKQRVTLDVEMIIQVATPAVVATLGAADFAYPDGQ